MEGNLHPALARIAASYDNIVEQFSQGLINSLEARARINELTARDDNGVLWRLDPDTALWQYLTISSEWKTATPPTSGLVLPTGHDISGNVRVFNPDSMISFSETEKNYSIETSRDTDNHGNIFRQRYKYVFVSIVIVLLSYLIYRSFEPLATDVIAPGEKPIDSR
jgi:hypothetical protein